MASVLLSVPQTTLAFEQSATAFASVLHLGGVFAASWQALICASVGFTGAGSAEHLLAAGVAVQGSPQPTRNNDDATAAAKRIFFMCVFSIEFDVLCPRSLAPGMAGRVMAHPFEVRNKLTARQTVPVTFENDRHASKSWNDCAALRWARPLSYQNSRGAAASSAPPRTVASSSASVVSSEGLIPSLGRVSHALFLFVFRAVAHATAPVDC
jgi:hypothetical protein